MFTVNYTISEQDYFDFNLYAVKTNAQAVKSVRLLRWVLPVAFAVILIISYITTRDVKGLLFTGAVYLIASLIWFFCVKHLFNALTKLNLKSQMKKSKSLYSPQGTLYFSDDAVKDVSAGVTTEIRYEKIERIAVQNNAVYLFYSPITAILVPFASFDTDAQREELMAFIKAKRPDLAVEA